MTRLSGTHTEWLVKYAAQVTGADPVTLPRTGGSRPVINLIDPRRVTVEWIATSAQQWLRVAIVGSVIKKDGEPGLRTNTRIWDLDVDSPRAHDLPGWVRDIIDEQIANGDAPEWGVELWKRQTT